MKSQNIFDRITSISDPPFVVAEMSGNHRGNINNAIKLLEQAHKSGANAIKLQTYTPDTMTIKSDNEFFKVSKGLWTGYSLYDLYNEAHTPWDWHATIFNKAKELGIECFSTPFDKTAVDFLENIGVSIYKVASFELNDLDLISYIASTNKPIIMSIGMANMKEIEDALNVIYKHGNSKICLLYCVSGYPTPINEANLLTLPELKKLFKNIVFGFSDHTLGTTASIVAVGLGARLIEKHFTLKRSDGGPDAEFSLEPHELKELVEQTKKAWSCLGEVRFERKLSEKPNLIFRRSIFSVKDIHPGQIINESNIKVIRPGYGLSPKEFKNIIGLKAKKLIKRGTPITWKLIEKN